MISAEQIYGKIVVKRDGVLVLNISRSEAHSLVADREVDEEIRRVLRGLLAGET